MTGREFEYTAKRGDYLARLGSRFGVSDKVLASANKLPTNRILQSGETVLVNNRHIVPPNENEDILINLPQRMLFLFAEDELDTAYPVGLGKDDWPTPSGKFRIMNRQENKPWIVPKSIQEEMAREGKAVITEIAPGPKNPLGKHWLGLSLPGIGIHGTIAPVSVYRFRSHGCIRMHPDDIATLFDKVNVDMGGRTFYAPVLMAQLSDNRVFLEVHHDIYKKTGDAIKIAKQLAESNGIATKIDWGKAEIVAKRKEGLANDVTLNTAVQENGRNEVWLKTKSLKSTPAAVF